MDDGIGVAEVLRQLRGDLALAEWQGEGKEPRFELGPIELEFQVTVDSSRQGGAKARLWVVEAGLESTQARSATHRIKLTIQPRQSQHPDRKPWISSEAAEGEQ
jgi:Trypsin-co-occurring domain 2